MRLVGHKGAGEPGEHRLLRFLNEKITILSVVICENLCPKNKTGSPGCSFEPSKMASRFFCEKNKINKQDL